MTAFSVMSSQSIYLLTTANNVMTPLLRISILVLLTTGIVLGLATTGCSNPSEPEKPSPINEDIVQVADCCTERNAQFIMGDWINNKIYTTKFPHIFELDDSLYSKREEQIFEFDGDGRPINYLELSRDGTHLLVVRSFYVDASVGSLHEHDLQSGERPKPSELPVLRDSSYAVGSAVYLPGSDGKKVVYYSYGSIPEGTNTGPTPGYYLLDTETGTDRLLIEHTSPAGFEEIFNGFDVSPDGRTLLYPINYDNFRESRSPQVARYDLTTGVRDTLDWAFRPQLLWLRYSPDGDQLLYNIYQEDAFSVSSGRVDSVGVISLSTGMRRSLETTTNSEGESIDLFPRWSPDGRHIVYGSGPVARESGAVGNFSLYVLKNVN